MHKVIFFNTDGYLYTFHGTYRLEGCTMIFTQIGRNKPIEIPLYNVYRNVPLTQFDNEKTNPK